MQDCPAWKRELYTRLEKIRKRLREEPDPAVRSAMRRMPTLFDLEGKDDVAETDSSRN